MVEHNRRNIDKWIPLMSFVVGKTDNRLANLETATTQILNILLERRVSK